MFPRRAVDSNDSLTVQLSGFEAVGTSSSNKSSESIRSSKGASTSMSTRDLERSVSHLAKKQQVFNNWAKTFYSRTTAVYKPESVDDVRKVVELARRQRKELRAAGSGHSPSDLVCTDGYIINIDKLNEFIEVDHEQGLFFAQAGMKLSDAHKHLEKHDLAMSSLGSISDQTLAGAISTATHGSSLVYGNLSSTVTCLDIVLPQPGAPVVRVSKEQDPDLFNASLCGLGSTGIIVAMGMRVEKRFKLEEELFVMKYDDFVRYWHVIAKSAQHARCWWFPQLGLVKVSRMNRTTKELTPKPSWISTWVTESLLAKYFHACALIVSKAFPRILPYHAWAMWNLVHSPHPIKWSQLLSPQWAKAPSAPALGDKIPDSEKDPSLESVSSPPLTPPPAEQRDVSFESNQSVDVPMLERPVTRVDWSVQVFNYDCGFPQYTYEAAVPLSTTTACLDALQEWHSRELYDPHGLRTHFPYEVRWTAKDDVWLSPTYGQTATYIGAIQYRPFGMAVPYKKIWQRFSAIMKLHGSRPHWAKSHTFSLDDLKKLYPRLQDWLDVRERADPEQVLVNPYIRRHLFGQVGEDVDFRRWKRSVLAPM